MLQLGLVASKRGPDMTRNSFTGYFIVCDTPSGLIKCFNYLSPFWEGTISTKARG